MKKKALLLFILRILKMGLGILNLSISAKYFGVSIDRDEWILALSFILVLDMAIWGPINETFRAKFVFLKHEIGNEASIAKVRSMFSFINFITVLLVIIILIYPRLLTSVISPKYTESQLIRLTTMILILTPSFLFNQICQFLTSVLNAYNTFYIPEIAGLFTAVINIVLIILLAPKFGIYALAFGYYLGIILLQIFLMLQLKKLKINVIGNPLKFSYTDVKPFLLFALPFFLPYFLGQISIVVEKSIASTLSIGTVSMIDYSRKFSEIAISVLTSIFTTMLLPVLSQYYAQKNDEQFLFEFKAIYQISFLIITFLIGIFTACPTAVINMLYNKGSITTLALTKISSLSMFYSWASLPVFMYIILGIVLLSSEKGKIYALYGSIAQIIMILFNLLLNKVLGVYTFPLSLLFSHLIVALLLFMKFPIKTNKLLINTIKGLGQVIICSLILYLINQNFLILNDYNPVVVIIFNIVLISIFILGYAYIAKTDDKQVIAKIISKIKAGA